MRLVREARGEHPSEWATICAIATELGCPAETLRKWVRRAEGGGRTGAAPATDDRQRLKDLERENRELRRTNEILRKASAFFAAAELDRAPGSRITVSFIDEHRHVYGVEPICAVLPTPKSTYYAWLRQRRDPSSRAARVQRDARSDRRRSAALGPPGGGCTARKVWRELLRTPADALGIDGPVARCTVERLMRQEGLAGVVRGRRVRKTVPADVADRPQDRVKRDFSAPAPNRLWVADFTYVATWAGFVYVAFVG